MKEDTDVQKQRKAKKKYPKILYHLFVAALALLMVYPLIWMVCSSFKETNTIFSTASKLIPEHFTLQNYVNGWKGFAKTSFGTFFFNTLIVDLVATAGTVISTTLVAYSLGRLRFKGRKFLFASDQPHRRRGGQTPDAHGPASAADFRAGGAARTGDGTDR